MDDKKPTQKDANALADFETRLTGPLEGDIVLGGIQSSIKRLLDEDPDSEAQIREILQARFDAGDLRPESVELVQEMLDRLSPDTEEELTLTGSGDLSLASSGELSLASSGELSLVEDEPAPAAPEVAEEAPDEDGDDLPSLTTTVAPVDDERAYKAGNGPPQVGTLVGGRFLLNKARHGGSLGTVFDAVDERLAGSGKSKSSVTIKILSPDFSANERGMRALQQEVAKGRCLTHPGIVRFIDLERDDDLHFLVMEELEGKSLARILEEAPGQKIDSTLALDIVRRVTEALDFAHRRGVVHADVKPGNIVIGSGGEVRLFDFGIARVRQIEQLDSPEFEPGEFGPHSPAYSSMQVLTGEEPVAADDVFSLGCLLYRLVAGMRVFGPRNAAEAASEGMEPQQPAGIEEVQWQAIKKALAYSRVPRFSACGEFLAALDGREYVATDVEEDTFPVDETGMVTTLPAAGSRKVLKFVVGGLATAAGAAAIAIGLLAGDEPEPPIAAVATPVAAVPDPGPIADAGESAVQSEIDYSAFLPPTLTVGLASPGQYLSVVDLELREGGEAATIDIVRMRNILDSYSVLLEEVLDENAPEGEPTAMESGMYEISNDGLLEFAPGESRARVTISMPPDSEREQDTVVVVRIREADDVEAELARIRLTLEDDDQRAFEASLPANTIAFAVKEMSVREVEAAVEIDVMRFQPDNEPAAVSYVVRDGTAVAGEDYFPPEQTTVNFGRGQRAARILIPLVQDVDQELPESFTLELVGNEPQTDAQIYQQIAVMIRDDD